MPRYFETTRRAQFVETDLAGIVHFSNYFRWMEEAEHAFFRSMGLSIQQERQGIEIGWPRVHATCEYLGPARFEDEVQITIDVTDLTEKSMTYEATFTCRDRVVARGRIKAVCCSLSGDAMTSIPIPAEIRARFDNPET